MEQRLRHYLPICIILLFCLSLSSCFTNHSSYREILDEASHLSDSDPYQALVKLEEIKNTKKLSEDEIAYYNQTYIKSALNSGNKFTSDSIIESTIEYYQNINDSVGLNQMFYFKGLHRYRMGKTDSAAIYFNKAFDMHPTNLEVDNRSRYKRMAGNSYLYTGDTGSAVSSYSDALKYSEIANDSLAIICSLIGLGQAYNYNKGIEKSLETLMLALDKSDKLNRADLKVSILNLISKYYETSNQFRRALEYKNRAQEIQRSRSDIPATNLYRAILYQKMNMPDSLQYYAQQAIMGSDQFVAEKAYQMVSDLEMKNGNYIEALNQSKNSERIFDSFISGVSSSDLQQKYQQEKLENENNQLKIKQKAHQLYLLMSIFLIVIMIIMLYIILINYKRKQKDIEYENNKIQLEQENIFLIQQKEISVLREKEAILRESLFKRINLFNKLPSFSQEDNNSHESSGKIIITDYEWTDFLAGIDDAYPNFIELLKSSATNLTDDDIRFCCLLKINIGMQDLADIYCVSKAAITKRKYRLKTEKFNIKDRDISLDTLLHEEF